MTTILELELPLEDDYEGKCKATLLSAIGTNEPENRRALIYVHGFNDYFHNEEFVKKCHEQGIDVFGVELRKYGRSLMPHQTQFFCQDLREYYEELNMVVSHCRDAHKYEDITLYGHSTGGLIVSMYMHEMKPKGISRMVLNSAFFDWNDNWFMENIATLAARFMGYWFPFFVMRKEGPVGGNAFHEQIFNMPEWSHLLDSGRNKSYKLRSKATVYAGFCRAVERAQNRLQRGLDIPIPILSLYSHDTDAYKPGSTDTVLDVKDINRYSDCLGWQVTEKEIHGALHDVFLSREEVRTVAYQQMFDWIEKNVPVD